GQRPPAGAVLRAYYVSLLGKYVPGQALALLLRGLLARESGVRFGVALLTAFYEILTTMAAGAGLAALLLAWQTPSLEGALDWRAARAVFAGRPDEALARGPGVLFVLAALLAVVLSVPLVPKVFNRLAQRLLRSSPQDDSGTAPRLGPGTLAEGLLLTAGGWMLLGASFWVVTAAVVPHGPEWSLTAWGRYTAYAALAYVASFVILVVPGGLGVREFLLSLFLVPEVGRLLSSGEAAARAETVVIVLVLRLVWTAAEVVMAGVV